jgi:SPOR domain
MNESKDKSGKEQLSDSAQLFENLFRDAPPVENKKAKTPIRGMKGQEAQPVRRPADTKKGVRPQSRPAGPPKAAGSTPPPQSALHRTKKKADQDARGPAGVTTPSKKQEVKSSSALKLVLLLFLLVVGAAVAASYMGFMDLGQYIGRPAERKSQPTGPQVARSIPEKKSPPQTQAKPVSERPKAQPPPPEAAASAEVTKPLPPLAQPAAAPSEDKLAKTEAPGTAALPEPRPTQAKPETQPPAKAPSPAVAQPPAPRIPAPQPAPAQPAATKAVPPLPQGPQAARAQAPHAPSYPFSVYLGSFANPAQTRTAVSIYEKDFGISSYWVKVDLKEKGTWYRLYTGAFQTAEQAKAFIRQKALKEGEVRTTKFSALIGVFSRPEEAQDTVKRLTNLGYSSYFVPLPDGQFNVYSGAFNSLEGAKNQSADLASKGIKGQAVER